jgi:hypothetical protein
MLRGGRKMKNENNFLKILIAVLIIINLFICLKSMRLEIEYNKLNKENMKLKKTVMEV